MRAAKNLTRVDGRLTDIGNGSRLHHIPHSESFDRLVFGDAARAVRATDKIDVTATFLVASAIPSFRSLDRKTNSNVPSVSSQVSSSSPEGASRHQAMHPASKCTPECPGNEITHHVVRVCVMGVRVEAAADSVLAGASDWPVGACLP